MDIKTKFSVGQEVFFIGFLDKWKVLRSTIDSICIEVNDLGGTLIQYYLTRDKTIMDERTRYEESELFATKEELIASL